MIDDLYTIDTEGTVTLAVHASPGAGRSSVVGRHGQALKVRVAAPPEGGRANQALVGLLAEEFGVPESAVELVSGPGSRAKRFRISGVDPDDFRRALERVVEGGNAGRGPGVRGRDTR